MPRPDRSRAALVDTAALLFRRQGYAATGVNQILETAGVKAGSLYHHFPDGKQELAAAVVDSVGGGIEQQLRRFLTGEISVADIVDGWIDTLAFAPDSQTLVSASYEGTVKSWNVVTGAELVIVLPRRRDIS